MPRWLSSLVRRSTPRSRATWLVLGWAWLAACAAQPAAAAIGDLVFGDDFEAGFGNWSTTSSLHSGINSMTWASASRSLYVRGVAVTTTSRSIDTRLRRAIRIQAWIRRGSDAFSEQTDDGEDLVIDYLSLSGKWITLATWAGGGTAGQILSLDEILAGSALHAGFRLRLRLRGGSGGPPDNGGIGWDYWHVDDVRISEADAPETLGVGSCEEFTNGLGSWTVATGYGFAQTSSQTANTAPRSLALQGGTASVTSAPVDLATLPNATLRLWIRRGDDLFSEDPDSGEDLALEYLSQSGSWTRLASYPGDGTPGEIVQPSFSLPSAARHSGFRLRITTSGWDGPGWDFWHVDSICLSTTNTTPRARAEWRFDEPRYTGTTDEVLDTSGNGFHGTTSGGTTTAGRSPALPGSPGTCNYASFDGRDDGITITNRPGLDVTAGATYALWLNPQSATGTSHLIGTDPFADRSVGSQMALFTRDDRLYGIAFTGSAIEQVDAPLPARGVWTHVALRFDGRSLVLHLNAREVARRSIAQSTLAARGRTLFLGNLPTRRGTAFYGLLDEIQIHHAALDANGIAEVMKTTRPCALQTVRFVIGHDGSGAHCRPETMSIRVLDSAGNPQSSHAGTIVLDTQTGTGSWSLVSGTGIFSDAQADDGLAEYTFAAGDGGQASFALSYVNGPPTIDVDVYDAVSRDDDSEGLLVFSPKSLQLTARALPAPIPTGYEDPIRKTIAASPFEIHLSAVGDASGGASCGVITSYAGDMAYVFWVEHLDPVGAPRVPTVDKTAIARSLASGSKQIVRFDQGRARVMVQYKDTGRISVHAVDASNTEIAGSTGGFVSAPAELSIAAITNASGDANPGTAVPSGPFFARAGEAFRVVVDVLDAEGSPTPSFGQEQTPEGVRLTASTLVAPLGGRNGRLGDGTLVEGAAFVADKGVGRFQNASVAFDEVGAIRMRASIADGDFLGAGDVVGSESGTVGRFAPFRFDVVANAPVFATACAVGAFTWAGQPFGFAPGLAPELVVTAESALGDPTVNYGGDWFRLSNATLARRAYRAGGITVDESGLPATTIDPEISARGDGSALLRFSTGSGLALVRETPSAPFEAELELSLDVLDADGTAFPGNPFRVGGTTPGTGIPFDVSKRFQWGRLRLDNAYGSELVPLPMRLRTQRFDGRAFADDDSDSCSRIPTSALVTVPTRKDWTTTPSIENVPLLLGQAGLRFDPPRVTGSVDVRVDLGASGANLPWLRGDWPEDGNQDGRFDDDPTGRATFGIWEGRDVVIFQRELY